MRIYSTFKDYYDVMLSVMGGNDDNVHYNRKTEEIYLGIGAADKIARHNSKTFLHRYENIRIIGFCGKIHYFVKVLGYSSRYFHVETELDKFCSEVDEELTDGRNDRFGYFAFREIDAICGTKYGPSYQRGLDFHHAFRFEEFFDRYKTPIFMFENIRTGYPDYTNREFDEHCLPIERDKVWKLTLNPNLLSVGFQKIVDPNTAIQELRMYLSNILTTNNTPQMPVGSDEVIAASKGFDKYSFRKMPTKKRK